MKCPKCGHENGDGEIFCSECDWQLNREYSSEPKIQKVVITTYVGLVFGVAALIVSTMNYGLIGAIFGAIGMVMSSYSLTLVRVAVAEDRKTLMLVITGAALIASVIGFVIGFTRIF